MHPLLELSTSEVLQVWEQGALLTNVPVSHHSQLRGYHLVFSFAACVQQNCGRPKSMLSQPDPQFSAEAERAGSDEAGMHTGLALLKEAKVAMMAVER